MTLTSVDKEIKYDQWRRPLITPPSGGKAVAYTRATTLAGATEDLNNLIDWKVGRAMIGLVERPDLLLSAAAHRDDKKKMRALAQEAAEAGGASSSATTGTALHAFYEKINRGQPTGKVPDEYKPDVAAYELTMAKLTPILVEQRIVVDSMKITGTPDLVATYDGENYITDVKTGSIDYPHKMAAQLAIYAHGEHYDHRTGTRTPLPAVNGQRGIIIHAPAGTGTCTLHWIDLTAGWEAVHLAVQVREWRSRKNLLAPVDEFQQAFDNLTATGLEPSVIVEQPADPIAAAIAMCVTAAELGEVWKNAKSDWQPKHTAQAAKKKKELGA